MTGDKIKIRILLALFTIVSPTDQVFRAHMPEKNNRHSSEIDEL